MPFHYFQARNRIPFLRCFHNDWVTTHILAQYFAGQRYSAKQAALEEDLTGHGAAGAGDGDNGTDGAI